MVNNSLDLLAIFGVRSAAQDQVALTARAPWRVASINDSMLRNGHGRVVHLTLGTMHWRRSVPHDADRVQP